MFGLELCHVIHIVINYNEKVLWSLVASDLVFRECL